MQLAEIVLIGIGLAMDAFAVSICKGLSMKKINIKNMFIIALYFGLFQGGMPLIGYLLGSSFSSFIEVMDHWVAFVLLSIIGINMIKDGFDKNQEKVNDSVDIKTMFTLAVATSIDALAVGISFSFLKVDILKSAFIICFITFLLSLVGVFIGNKFGSKYEKKAQILGGIILIIIGLKILLEHLGIL